MAKSRIKNAIFEGGEEYAIPLLEHFESLAFVDDPDRAIARFRFENGVSVRVPISSLALDPLFEALKFWIAKRAEAEAKNQTKH